MFEIHDFLNSIPFRLGLKKRRRGAFCCPICRGNHVRRVSYEEDRDGYSEIEKYRCRDCGCSWEWTFKRPFLRFRIKIRAPKWVRID